VESGIPTAHDLQDRRLAKLQIARYSTTSQGFVWNSSLLPSFGALVTGAPRILLSTSNLDDGYLAQARQSRLVRPGRFRWESIWLLAARCHATNICLCFSDVLDALDLSGFHAALSYVMTRKKIWRSSVSPYPLFREVVQQLHS